MGTNYYLHQDTCPHCGRSETEIHIGKSSYGWAFALHVMPEHEINSLDDWIPLWEKGVIKNEYDDTITPKEMLDIVTAAPKNKIKLRERGVQGGKYYDLVKGDFS